MRLTHAITMQADNRADLQVTVLPEGDALPITLEQDGGAINDGQTVYMSFEQYDVMAELVERVRVASNPPGVIDECGYDWNDDAQIRYCCLATGHTTNGAWLHVAADGSCKTR